MAIGVLLQIGTAAANCNITNPAASDNKNHVDAKTAC